MPLALGGLLLFVLFQQLAFSEPLGFIQTQDFWRHRAGGPFRQDPRTGILGTRLVRVYSFLAGLRGLFWRSRAGLAQPAVRQSDLLRGGGGVVFAALGKTGSPGPKPCCPSA